MAKFSRTLAEKMAPSWSDTSAGWPAASARDRGSIRGTWPISSSGATLAEAWSRAASVAQREAAATADLLPRMGRARPHAEKSIGTPDPGAHSFALIVCASEDVFVGVSGDRTGETS